MAPFELLSKRVSRAMNNNTKNSGNEMKEKNPTSNAIVISATRGLKYQINYSR